MENKKQIRANFRKAVFGRDKNKCRLCDKPAKDAHHIVDRNEMPNGGYVASNGISVCEDCHILAEEYHSTQGKSGIEPQKLYEIIDSSYEKAYRDSERSA